MIALKMVARNRVWLFVGAASTMFFAVLVALGGLRYAAFAADSSTSASAASASATSTSAEAAEATSSSASASSASAEPSGHQSVVYATDEAKTSSERNDNKSTLPAGMTSTWSIVDLVCAIANLAFSIALLSDAARKRVAGFVTRGRAIIGGVSAVLALAGILALALTQNYAATMSVADELSLVFVAFLVVQVILFAIAKLGMKNES